MDYGNSRVIFNKGRLFFFFQSLLKEVMMSLLMIIKLDISKVLVYVQMFV